MILAALLSACDEGPSQEPGIELAESAFTVQKPEADLQPDPASGESLQAGEYRLQVFNGKISLNAVRANRIAILEELAREIGFELRYASDIDEVLMVDLVEVGTAVLLRELLNGVLYQADYNAETDRNGFRIARLSVGTMQARTEAIIEEDYSKTSIESERLLPGQGNGIYLGSDPEAEDLAARLQYGSIEDQVLAISELTVDPRGISAAYQVYSSTPSPRVRTAVLELVDSEELYLAKSMVVLSLQSLDPAEAKAALEIIDMQDDFTLAPLVEEVSYNHHDASVRDLALEVLQSITAGYEEADITEESMTPIDTSSPARRERGSGSER